jgi:hypothetical protein
MGERLNFICLGGRILAPHEHRPCVEAIVSRLAGPKATLVEVMRIDGRTGADTVLPWDASAKLVEASIDAGALLVAYFTIAGNDAAGRQSVTLDTWHNSTVVTLSLEPRVVSGDGALVAVILADLAGWAAASFETAVLACGPELDLYEVGDEQDVRRIEERLASDWRCWLSMYLHRFPKRMTVEE